MRARDLRQSSLIKIDNIGLGNPFFLIMEIKLFGSFGIRVEAKIFCSYPETTPPSCSKGKCIVFHAIADTEFCKYALL